MEPRGWTPHGTMCARCRTVPREGWSWNCSPCRDIVAEERRLFTTMAAKWRNSGEWLTQPCDHCGELTTNIDHIVPISCGGSHDRANLRPMCKPCNSQALPGQTIAAILDTLSTLPNH